MKVAVGDKVKFLNDVGGGIVERIIDEKTALVLNEEGFEYPFAINELIKIGEIEKADFFRTESVSPAKPLEVPKTIENILADDGEIITKDNEEVNIYLAFVPEDAAKPTTSKQQLRLINDSNWHLMFVYQISKNRTFESFPSILQPNYIEELRTFTLQEINEIKEIIVQIIFFRKIPYDVKEPVFKLITIKPQRFYEAGSFKTNDFFDQKAIIFPIIEENPLKEAIHKLTNKDLSEISVQKEKSTKKTNELKKEVPKIKSDLLEIDLHINFLLENTVGMEAKEMLDYQMNVFKEELEKAKKNNLVKKIVFVHGKGNGRLKTEIRSYLERNKINYQDASFQKYGFGATLVFV